MTRLNANAPLAKGRRGKLLGERDYHACSHAATFTVPGNAFALAEIIREIASLRAVQAPFGWIFWRLEKRIARLTDQLERMRS